MSRTKQLLAASAAGAAVLALSLGSAGGGAVAAPKGANDGAGAPAAAPAPSGVSPSLPAVLTAVVDSNGALNRGKNVVSSTKIAGFTGAYEVIFNRNVRRCTYQATEGFVGSVGTAPPGYATVVGRFSSVNGVFVQAYDAAGNDADRAFHLTVNC